MALTIKNTLHERPECVVKDGVWIQVMSQSAHPRAVHDAVLEQEKINQIVEHKEARLRKFQADVRKRVTKISRAQREIISQKQSENMKVEQEVLYRSVAAAEHLTPRKNRCSYNVNQVTIDASGKLTANFNHDDNGRSELVKQSTEVERQHRTARQNLAERCIVKSCPAYSDEEGSRTQNNLPGGLWGSGVTRDKSAHVLLPSKLENYDQEEVNGTEPQTITAVTAPCDIAIAAVQESITASRKNLSSLTLDLPTVLNLNDDEERPGYDQENVDPDKYVTTAPNPTPTAAYFKSACGDAWERQDLSSDEGYPPTTVPISRLENQSSCTSANPVKSHRCPTEDSKKNAFPVAAPGVVAHQKRKMDERSRLLSRRVFSDMERERVREERRRREHRNKVEKLRAEKEAERLEHEKQHDARVHAAETEQRQSEIAERMKAEKRQRKKQDRIDQRKKNERFVSALKARIQERLEFNKIVLPPLCGCSQSFWQTNPYTCANNCVFYKNMSAYTAALQSVLNTMERGMTSSSCRHDKSQDLSVISLLASKEM